jgi:cation-transporting ATPase 13A2
MGFTRPVEKLTPRRPPDRLMSLGIWLPVVAQFVTCALFQAGALAMLSAETWYRQFDPHPGSTGTNCFDRDTANSASCSQSWENSAIFLISLAQFLITAFVFNKGPPHRRPLWTNRWLLAAISLQTLFLLFLVCLPGGPVVETFAGMVPFPEVAFRWKLLLLMLLNLAASYLADQLAEWGYEVARGRRVGGLMVS